MEFINTQFILVFSLFFMAFSLNLVILEIYPLLFFNRISFLSKVKLCFTSFISQYNLFIFKKKSTLNFSKLVFFWLSVFLNILAFNYLLINGSESKISFEFSLVFLLTLFFFQKSTLSKWNMHRIFHLFFFLICIRTAFFLESKIFFSEIIVSTQGFGLIVKYPILALISFINILEIVEIREQTILNKLQINNLLFGLLVMFQSVFLSSGEDIFHAIPISQEFFDTGSQFVILTICGKYLLLSFSFLILKSFQLKIRTLENPIVGLRPGLLFLFYLLILVYKNEYF